TRVEAVLPRRGRLLRRGLRLLRRWARRALVLLVVPDDRLQRTDVEDRTFLAARRERDWTESHVGFPFVVRARVIALRRRRALGDRCRRHQSGRPAARST